MSLQHQPGFSASEDDKPDVYRPDGDAGTQRFVGCAEWFFIGR